jgi:biofilm PGA synthesis protein PgaA
MPELVVESTIGRSSDVNVGPNGSRDASIDAHLYSKPISYDWRVYMHTQLARSALPELNVNRNAVGGGVEYRARDFTATGEVFNAGNNGAGIALEADYRIGDYWHVNGLAESNSLSTPLMAYADGVKASNYQLGGGYRWHESRSVGLNVDHMEFSDGNQRNGLDMLWTEGLMASATYKLDATAEYYTSRNSSQSAQIGYFNPIRDQQVGISLRNEWLQFHRYEKSLKHVLTVGVGNYAQTNYPSRGIANIKYEQFYSPSDRLDFHYGIGRLLHPYDGAQTGENSITFGADWRF